MFTHDDDRLALLLTQFCNALFELSRRNMQGIDNMPFVEVFFITYVDYQGVAAVYQRYCLRWARSLAASALVIHHNADKSGEPTADQNGVVTQKLDELRHAESDV